MKNDINTFKLTLYIYKDKNNNKVFATKEELLKNGFDISKIVSLPSIRYYSELFGKKDVIHYVDDKTNRYQILEGNQEMQFNMYDSNLEQKYIWDNCKYLNTKEYLQEIRKRKLKKDEFIIAIVIKDDKVLIVKKVIDDNISKWVFPSEKAMENESRIDTITRKVEEETSVKVEVKKLLELRRNLKNGNYLTYYLCEYLSGEPKVKSEEIELAKFVTLEELNELVNENTYSSVEESIKKYVK